MAWDKRYDKVTYEFERERVDLEIGEGDRVLAWIEIGDGELVEVEGTVGLALDGWAGVRVLVNPGRYPEVHGTTHSVYDTPEGLMVYVPIDDILALVE